METKPNRDHISDKKINDLHVRVTDREFGLISAVAGELEFPSVSEAIRELIIIGSAELLNQKTLELSPDMIRYIEGRKAKLDTEFKSYQLTSVRVEQERIEDVEQMCKWHYERSDHGVNIDSLEAILSIIEDAKGNLNKPLISNEVRDSLMNHLMNLAEEYKARFDQNKVGGK